ncbi:rhamnulokinase family protein [Dysgonomonas sp. 520]|uniref:rhamnulokinase n=1 Tax=Dysgonomonas sp. 520 TaxID=2302931 RepID=UPI0013D86AF4|nr:rhamnulokinase family protein [Dysgonomonas sp. 520]NDW08664.1 rhamnulokinase [Dysgonomonas sp. 520]
MSYLALDLGAGSGRAIVGTISDGKVHLEEVHRFNNTLIQQDDTLCWDFLSLFENIKLSISLAVRKGYDLKGIAVDTWGVDFGLLDKSNNLLSNPVCYRDSRTEGLSEKSAKCISKEELYSITGIQQMDINTIFQLWSMRRSDSPHLSNANRLLFTPDLINYFLTGVMGNEYTIASTSQLLNARTKEWSAGVFKAMDIPADIMGKILQPCTLLGGLTKQVSEETGAKGVKVFVVGSHDTASAIAAIPGKGNNWAFLSSGTWSLLGTLNDEPILTQEAMTNDFTNEGGVDNKILFMRNITGLWLLQRIIGEWEKEGLNTSYDYILSESSKAEPFRCIVNSDDPVFNNPSSMKEAIQAYCSRSGQHIPETQGELVRCILESLAIKYYYVMDRLKKCSGKDFTKLYVVGGGSQNEQLNQYIADALDIEVVNGLTEATAVGNVIQQAIADEKISGWEEAYEIIENSFNFKSYYPEDTGKWKDTAQNVSHLFK